MNVQHFVRWCQTASSRQRALAFATLARAFLEGRTLQSGTAATLAVLHMVLDDPSPMVRREIAGMLGDHPQAPRSLLNGFLRDNDDIALCVTASKALSADDLVRTLFSARVRVQIAIAARRDLPPSVTSAIAWRCGLAACRTLLANDAAKISREALRRLSDRFGTDAPLRTLLASRDDLPADVRQTLMLEVARDLQTATFVRRVLGDDRVRPVVFRCGERATATIGENAGRNEAIEYIEHLRSTGQLTSAFLIRSACVGNIELLAVALTALSGLSQPQVRAIVVDGRDGPFHALLRNCGFSASAGRVVRTAVCMWKKAAMSRASASRNETTASVVERILAAIRSDARCRSTAAVTMLRDLETEVARDFMRTQLDDLLAA